MIFVGIDVAKDKHDCFILNSEGTVLADVFTIANNRIGFETLLYMLGPMRKLYGAVWHVFKAPSQFTGMRLLFRAVLSN